MGKCIKDGKSGVGPLTSVDAEKFPAKVAAEVKDFDIEEYIERKEARKWTVLLIMHCCIYYGSERCKFRRLLKKMQLVLVFGLVLVLVEWKHMKNNFEHSKKVGSSC